MATEIVKRESNGFYSPAERQQSTTVSEVAQARAAKEVEAAVAMAKRFPRDEYAAHNAIMRACQRVHLAEAAVYRYPRGGETVTGPSIRLAEAMAQNWGNIDFGFVELDNSNGSSQVLAYAWDLQTNVRQTRTFSVPHIRYTRNGSKTLTDPRDIYETVANNAARRVRACVLGVIPGDIQEDALAACQDTLRKGDKSKPLADRVRDMVTAYGKLSVTKKMLEDRLDHGLDSVTEDELLELRQIYCTIRDNNAGVDEFFDRKKKKQTVEDLKAQAKPKDEAPDGGELLTPDHRDAIENLGWNAEELAFLVREVTKGRTADYQMLSPDEAVELLEKSSS